MIVRRPKSVLDKFYIPAILQGLALTFRHLMGSRFTLQYPEETVEHHPGYRGAHRLNKDSKGRIKCVACEMCSTACPANCITISPSPSEWMDRERVPEKFEINMLRCIYCGMCEEACPEDAIELTYIDDLVSYTRSDMIWDKDKLLRQFDLTTNNQPMKTAQRGASMKALHGAG